MNEKELAAMPREKVLRLLKAQVDAAINIPLTETPSCCGGQYCSSLNLEVGDFRITARFTEPDIKPFVEICCRPETAKAMLELCEHPAKPSC